jgi:hypothetical protein
MRRISSRQRANAALLLAAAAVAIAIGGTAGALPGKGRVDSGDVRNNTLRSKDLRDGRAVGRPDLVADQQTRWALVDGTGETILAQSGGITIDTVSSDSNAGYYILDFGMDLRGRALIASLGGSTAGMSATATNCGGGSQGVNCPGVPSDPRYAIVTTHPSGGPHDFYIVLLPR